MAVNAMNHTELEEEMKEDCKENCMEEWSRTKLLLGVDAMERLSRAKIAVFGVGGVGGHVVEALARCGVGSFVLTDNDKVSLSNINRQIIALHSTVGRLKTEVIRERILDINPAAAVELHNCFYLPESHDRYDFAEYDYVVDCIDTVAAKLDIIVKAKEAGTPVISSMGTGNKMKPQLLEVADIYQTSVCPLARVMRYELKRRGISSLKVVYSKETPIKAFVPQEAGSSRRGTPGSNSFVPAAAGLLIASEIAADFLRLDWEK